MSRIASNTFRFCIVRGLKRTSTIWCVDIADRGFQFGTRTPLGTCRITFMPEQFPRVHIRLPHSPHRAESPESTLVVGAPLKPLPQIGLSHTVSLIFPTDHLPTFREAPVGRKGRLVHCIDAAPEQHAIKVSAFVSHQAPDSVRAADRGLGARLNAWSLTRDRYLYLYTSAVPAPDLPVRPTGLPGIDIFDPIRDAELTFLQTSPGAKVRP